jgi:drug/metabolite transporter (DMT)-like permease
VLVTVFFGVCTQAPQYYAFNHMAIGTAQRIFYARLLLPSYVVGRLACRERIGPAKVASFVLALGGLIGLSELLFAVFPGFVLLREHLTPCVLAGGALIIVAAMRPDVAALAARRREA